MSHKKAKQHRRDMRQKILKTLWRIPDDAWAEVVKLLPPEKALQTPGRPGVPFRRVFDGILLCPPHPLPMEGGAQGIWFR